MMALLDGVLVILVLALACWALLARDAFAAVIGFVAYGLLLALAWMQLQAPDVALTEAALGGGLTGILLIRAVARLRGTETQAQAEQPGAHIRVGAALLGGGVALVLGYVVLALPDPAPTLAAETAANLAATEVANPLTAVLLAFRAIDTLLESIVVLFALIGVWSFAPDRAWGGRPGRACRADPDGPLAYLARVLPPLGFVIGLYIFWIGADLPGGKFQGATILAAMWLLAVLAGFVDTPPVGRTWLRVALVFGPAAFIAVGVAGSVFAGAFLAHPDGLAKAFIVVVEWALLPSLAVTLALILVGAPERAEE